MEWTPEMTDFLAWLIFGFICAWAIDWYKGPDEQEQKQEQKKED